MDAIIYTSNTGTTAEYARLLGEATGLPVYALKDAGSVKAGAEIIYLGWLMASGVKGYKKAAKRYAVKAVCGVGMGKSGTQIEEVRKANAGFYAARRFRYHEAARHQQIHDGHNEKDRRKGPRRQDGSHAGGG